MGDSKFRNLILQHLDREEIERLELQPIILPQGKVLEQPGARLERLVFVEDGIASMTTIFEDGSQVEAGMFGLESVIGAPSLMGMESSINHIAVQMPGNGYSARREAADTEFRRQESFRDLVLRYMQSQVLQASQSAGCNARHNVQQRLARWVLQCSDRVTTDVLQLTQEFLAAMLGVERPAVSVVARQLQERGLIEYSRGRIRLVDRAGLEAVACECYQVARKELRDFEQFAQNVAARRERNGRYSQEPR